MKKINVIFEYSKTTMLKEITDIVSILEGKYEDNVNYECCKTNRKSGLRLFLRTAEIKCFISKLKE